MPAPGKSEEVSFRHGQNPSLRGKGPPRYGESDLTFPDDQIWVESSSECMPWLDNLESGIFLILCQILSKMKPTRLRRSITSCRRRATNRSPGHRLKLALPPRPLWTLLCLAQAPNFHFTSQTLKLGLAPTRQTHLDHLAQPPVNHDSQA